MASLFVCLIYKEGGPVNSLQKKITAAVMIVVATHYIKKWAKS